MLLTKNSVHTEYNYVLNHEFRDNDLPLVTTTRDQHVTHLTTHLTRANLICETKHKQI